jgi:hypothetical protein
MSEMNTPIVPIVPETPVAGAPEVKAGEGKPTTPERMYTVKVNGKEEQWPESKVIERAQKGEGAEVAMQRSAQLEKAFNAFVSQASDPMKLLGLLEHPSMKYDEEKQEMLVKAMMNSKKPRIINAVKQWIYENEIEPKTLDPKDLELRELKAFKASQEKIHAEQEKERAAAEDEAKVKHAWNDYRTRIGAEIKTIGLPETESTVARIARYALLYTKAGKPVDLADCAKRVKSDLIAEQNERYSTATEDNILDLLPEGMAERINKALMKRLKKSETETAKAEGAPTEKKSTAAETREMMKKLERGGKVF